MVLKAHCPYVETGPGPVLTLAEIRVPGGIPHRDLWGMGVPLSDSATYTTLNPWARKPWGRNMRWILGIADRAIGCGWGRDTAVTSFLCPQAFRQRLRWALRGVPHDAPGSTPLASVPRACSHLTVDNDRREMLPMTRPWAGWGAQPPWRHPGASWCLGAEPHPVGEGDRASGPHQGSLVDRRAQRGSPVSTAFR